MLTQNKAIIYPFCSAPFMRDISATRLRHAVSIAVLMRPCRQFRRRLAVRRREHCSATSGIGAGGTGGRDAAAPLSAKRLLQCRVLRFQPRDLAFKRRALVRRSTTNRAGRADRALGNLAGAQIEPQHALIGDLES